MVSIGKQPMPRGLGPSGKALWRSVADGYEVDDAERLVLELGTQPGNQIDRDCQDNRAEEVGQQRMAQHRRPDG